MISFQYSDKLEAYVTSSPGNFEGDYFTSKEYNQLQQVYEGTMKVVQNFINFYHDNSKCYSYVNKYLTTNGFRATSDNIFNGVYQYLMHQYPIDIRGSITQQASNLTKELVKRSKKVEPNF